MQVPPLQNAVLPSQYSGGILEFRDVSDYTLFKKRLGISQVYGEPVRPPILQSLQNRTSYQFALLNCPGCPGGFPQLSLSPPYN